MRSRLMAAVTLMVVCLSPQSPAAEQKAPAKTATRPENLALKATASATSEYSNRYEARFAVNGKIPAAGCRADLDKAWAVKGSESRNRARFTLLWDKPVPVAEIIYYGRTAWLVNECWKDYEVHFDDGKKPVAKGQLQMGSGAQRIKVPPATVKKIQFKFNSSYGGPNPGASEIEVYAQSPPEAALPKFGKGSISHPSRPTYKIPDESPELAKAVKEGELGFDKLIMIKRQQINPSHVYTVYCEGFRPGGGLCVLSPPRPDGKLTELLATKEGQILDLDLSYDAQEIVFSWRKRGNQGYHIYRMNVDGTGLTQLTDGNWHDYNACWLPDGGIAFCSTRAVTFVLCFHTPSGVLYRMDRDGKNVRRLSQNYVNDFTPSVMPDGRILYSRWEYVDKPAIPIQSLWTIFPDGTNLHVFYGNRVLSPASFLEARAIPGTDSALCTLTAHNGPVRGGLGIVDSVHGVNAQKALTNLTPEVNIGQVNRGSGNHVRGPYQTPLPLDEKRYLATCKGAVLLGEVSGKWAIVYQGKDNFGYYDAEPVRPRAKPPVLTSNVAGEVRPSGEDRPASATVYLLDVYNGLEPDVARGQVKALRVIEELHKGVRTSVLGFGFQRPVISCGATYAPKKVWGTVPVEEDGSAHFCVPADRAIYFEALDENGLAVQRMRSFAHFPSGERQGCIGCHEPRSDAPRRVRPTAVDRPAEALARPEWGRGNFDYVSTVQPVLNRYCTKCHSGATPPKGIDLCGDRTDWFNVSYDLLTRGYVSWIDTRNGREANILQIAPKAWGSPASKLAKLILANHPDAAGKPRVEMDPQSRRRIFAWIDLNVPYYGTYDMANPKAEGGRRIYPKGLDSCLSKVAQRRCGVCHAQGVPSRGFVRVSNPELNDFLMAPLAKAAGGRESCGKPIFLTKDDPDYQVLLAQFSAPMQMLAARPRMDMPGACAAEANRSCR